MSKDNMNAGTVNDPKHNVGARNDAINNTFKKIFDLERELDAMMEKHCQPLKDDIKKQRRNLKKDTDIDGKDLTLFYKIYARNEGAKLLEEEDRDRIHENLAAVYEAMNAGGQLDFIEAMDDKAG